jgi:hypothetical protein
MNMEAKLCGKMVLDLQIRFGMGDARERNTAQIRKDNI